MTTRTMVDKYMLKIQRKKIIKLCMNYSEYQQLDLKEQEHLIAQLSTIVQWYNDPTETSLGHFLTAVVKNDFVNAVSRADKTNIRCLIIFAQFLYNYLPLDYKQKAEGL